MSSNRLNNDKQAYLDTLQQSTGPGKYNMYKSPILYTNFYPTPPSIRVQKSGNALDSTNKLVDVHSNLLNLNMPREKNAQHSHMNTCENMCDSGYPCGQGVVAKCIRKQCGDMKNSNLKKGKECFVPVESTRLSNPPCTMRGLDTFRIDYLCLDPQKNLEMPFKHNTSVRLYEKDRYVPCNNVPVDNNNCDCENCDEEKCDCSEC